MLQTISGLFFIGYISFFSFFFPLQKTVYKTKSGTITFLSEAPLETITATSNELKGLIDTTANTFAFSVSVNTFTGFNSSLQQQHFYENYMESTAYPVATFSGKIIEIIDYSKPGTYNVRAKGILNIHGVKTERLIRGTVEVKNKELLIRSSFIVNLQDHNIKIPRIVTQKIASEISIELEAILSPVQI